MYFIYRKLKGIFLAFKLLLLPIILYSYPFSPVPPKHPDTIVITTFRVDMTYMVAMGIFNPDSDFVDLAGTMNGWTGSPHMTRDSGLVYSTTYELTPDLIYYYRYRINGDSALMEFPLGPLRVLRGPNFPVTVSDFYRDYDPGAIPMTFLCNLWYQIKAGHFNPLADWLDVAGNFNNNGYYDLLLPANLQDTLPAADSLYKLTKLIDTSYLSGPPLSFKFRFNGSWNSSELPDPAPYRTYQLQDTAGNFENVFTCWYNNIDPSVPAPPFAYNVSIHGILAVGQILTGAYTYEDTNLDPEGISLYQWFWADDKQGTNLTAIPSADSVNFIPTSSEAGKYIMFEVLPVASMGDSLLGAPVKVYSDVPIGGLGLPDPGLEAVRFYPNPVSEVLHFANLGNIRRIEVYNITGSLISRMDTQENATADFNVTGLLPGIYFLKFTDNSGRTRAAKFVRN